VTGTAGGTQGNALGAIPGPAGSGVCRLLPPVSAPSPLLNSNPLPANNPRQFATEPPIVTYAPVDP
jgi:hypothetical protein